MSRRVSRISRIAAGAAALVVSFGAALGAPADSVSPAPSAAADQERADKEIELRGVEDIMRASEDQRRQIESEIETIRADRARLSAALIETTAKVQDAERGAAAAQDRLASLNATADELSHSLERRRAVIADVLAALQRMGSDPPPAILVKPRRHVGSGPGGDCLGFRHTGIEIGDRGGPPRYRRARQDEGLDCAGARRTHAEGRRARARQDASRRAHRRAPEVARLGARRARLAAATRGGSRQTGDVA